MSSFIVSINAVLPMFLLIVTGLALRRFSVLQEKAALVLNNLVFVVLMPPLLFNNLRNADIGAVLHPSFIFFVIGGCLGAWGLAALIAKGALRDPGEKGAFIQGMARSNFVLFGLPLFINLCGAEHAGLISFTAVIIIPLFNFLSVLVLEIFRPDPVQIKGILYGFVTNPMILGSAAGVVFMILRIPVPSFVDAAIVNLANAATPMALVVLGAMLAPSKVKEHLRPLSIAVIGKLVIIPVLTLLPAIAIGFRGPELATLVAIFASPTAVASFVMAAKMDSDRELSAEIVVFTTLFSSITVFLWIFYLHLNGFLTV